MLNQNENGQLMSLNHHSVPAQHGGTPFPLNFKWNTNSEVARILYAAPHHPQWLSHHVDELPRSGTQQLFSRYDGNWFKADHYEWRKRREGKLIREDHMKLKVNKQEVLSANYTHSAIVPTFHRRVYWLTSNPDFVFVHHLNTSEESEKVEVVNKVVCTMRANRIASFPRPRLQAQVSKIYADTFNEQGIQSICDMIVATLQNSDSSQSHQASSHGFMLERRNSCSSAFRSGLSSMALRRQPSTFSDSVGVDASYSGAGNCGEGDVRRCAKDVMYSKELDAGSHSEETQRSSNQDEEMSLIRPQSTSIRSASGGTTSQTSMPTDTGTPSEIVDIAPTSCDLKGGCRVLIIGDWYMKGHVYSVVFGEKKVLAKLVRPGVLALNAPAASVAGTVAIRVLCNDVVVSRQGRFVYEDLRKDDLLQSLIDRSQLLIAAFGANEVVKSMSSFPSSEAGVSRVLRSLEPLPLLHPNILSVSPSLPARTILHILAALDFPLVMQQILAWRRSLPYNREMDPLSRDCEGMTPLHIAARHGNAAVARVLVECCPSVVDVLDDRGRIPCDLTTDDTMSSLTSRQPDGKTGPSAMRSGSDEHVTSTALWVMTNGETVTDQHLLRDLRTSRESTGSSVSDMQAEVDGNSDHPSTSGMCYPPPLHVEISMDTDVHVPDSPKMADLFQAVTSPGVMLNDNTRQKMANLAKQIIAALPARIKNDSSSLLEDEGFPGGAAGNVFTFPDHLSHMIGSEMSDEFWPLPHTHVNNMHTLGLSGDRSANSVSNLPSTSSYDQHLCPQPETSLTSSINTFEGSSFDFDKDLGEFFTINVDGHIDPIQQRLGDLKLSDGEQREVYEAAMVIQRAYREYRERHTNRRQADVERRAAVTIQCCYRRYKQFCYFKKLHNAAIVVQKHFRLKKVNQRESASMIDNEVQEHPTLEGQILRIQVPQNSSSLLREHRAAATIQAAYRGHRKRQAAARKIQKFMKESRMKLRRMAEQSDDVSCVRPRPPSMGSPPPRLQRQDIMQSSIQHGCSMHMSNSQQQTALVTDGK